METCWSCGANLTPGAEWCGLCHAPVERPAESTPSGRDPQPGATPVPRVSVVLGGPTSFGLVGKLLVTAVIGTAGYALYLVAGKIGEFFGTAGLALVVVMLAVYAIGAVLVLWGIWRPQRID